MHVQSGDAHASLGQRIDRSVEFPIFWVEPKSTVCLVAVTFAGTVGVEIPIDAQSHRELGFRFLQGQLGGPCDLALGVQIHD